MTMNSHLLEAADMRTLIEKVGIDQLMDDLIDRLVETIKAYDPAIAQVPPRNGVHYLKPEWGPS